MCNLFCKNAANGVEQQDCMFYHILCLNQPVWQPSIWNACHTGQCEPVLQQINKVARCFFVDGKTRNSPIQLILQQIHKTSCTFLVACFSIPLSREFTILSELASYVGPIVRRIQDYPAISVFFLNSMHDSNGFQ